ncbi:pyridoxamine 5'-phosphate oxidase [Candidatus Endowatersipora endosymbiont of Watersipora subatra]|uniref:pyridoxamine 5'-phosphate oxidase n=1 Tax=Candidatus Endowatersipora endosymbiont of Watersipora subatra TaxID=3077946 RepID=UPI00312C9D2D
MKKTVISLKNIHPVTLFHLWLKEAEISEINDPSAGSLATVGEDGMPNIRIVLLKAHDERGYVFYTNFKSTKGQEILRFPKVALGFHWKSLRRQVRVRGKVEEVTKQEADAYFNSRHRQSQIGAWASYQSQPLKDRQTLITRVKEYRKKYSGENIPRPPHWSGLRLIPQSIEFWQDGKFRLHERILFERSKVGGGWKSQFLNP